MDMRVAVIGAGSWGTTVARLACENVQTVLWARDADLAAEIDGGNRNGRYLADFELPPQLHATADLEEACRTADVVVMAVPSHGFRAVLEQAAEFVRPWVPVLSLTKGFELGSLLRPTEMIAEVLPGHPFGVLTGPNLAREIMAEQPAASVVATYDETIAVALQQIFTTRFFRVYTNPDVIGCELGGALKNVMAIGTGMADGMGFGDNTSSALVTRGLAELTRLGVALGGDPLTFSGLAGMGDLVATCFSTQSRNHHVGYELGRGRSIDDIIAEMNMVAEGVKSSKSVLELARRHQVDMPIAEQVHAACHEGRTAEDVLTALLGREVGFELEGISTRGFAQPMRRPGG